MAIGIVVSDMRVNIVKLEQVRSERIVLEKKVTEWSEIVETYNKYRDGYYQLAILEHSLGNSQKAYEHLQKAMSIDPNFSKALELMEKIAGK
jgi:tetratricopeptide (TPR) repeat protein